MNPARYPSQETRTSADDDRFERRAEIAEQLRQEWGLSEHDAERAAERLIEQEEEEARLDDGEELDFND